MYSYNEKLVILAEYRDMDVPEHAEPTRQKIIYCLQDDLLTGGDAFEQFCGTSLDDALAETLSLYGDLQ